MLSPTKEVELKLKPHLLTGNVRDAAGAGLEGSQALRAILDCRVRSKLGIVERRIDFQAGLQKFPFVERGNLVRVEGRSEQEEILIVGLFGTWGIFRRAWTAEYEPARLETFGDFARKLPVDEEKCLSAGGVVTEHDVMPLRVRWNSRSDDGAVSGFVSPLAIPDANRFAKRPVGAQAHRFEGGVTSPGVLLFTFRHEGRTADRRYCSIRLRSDQEAHRERMHGFLRRERERRRAAGHACETP